MIPILKSGDSVVGFLVDATSCTVTEERNGIYEMELTYPVAGPLFGELMVDRCIQAKPNDTADLQLFRIYEISKPLNGIVTVNGEHVSYALAHYPVTDVSITGTATQAVSAILAKINAYMSSHRFTVAETGFASVRNFKYQVGSARAALGGSEGSVLDTYGGEFEFDNYTVKIHEHRGRDTGVVVAYRKNMTDLKVTTSLDSAYTRLFPYAIKDDTLITISGGTISVPNTSGIAERVMIRDFSSDFEEEETVDASRLQTKAEAYLRNKDINAPAVNISVSFVHLWQSPEYADVVALEQVSLCDYVTVRHEILGVDIKAQVIRTVYDSLSERYESIELGEARANFQDTVKNAVQDVSRLIQKLDTELDTSAITQAYMQAIADATNLITGADGGYVHLIPSQNPQEIVISDIEDFKSTAAKVWRWNKNGLGYSSTGYSGTYTTAITKDGKINAGMITTGTLNASIITAGVLQSADGESSFDLESGKVSTRHNFGSFSTEANMTTGRFQLMYNGVEIGGLGTVEGGFPYLFFNEDNAGKIVIGGGNSSIAKGKIIVENAGTRFHGANNNNVCRIDDYGIHGTLHGDAFGNLNGDIYKESDNIYFCIGGTAHGYINPDKGYIGRLDAFETWKNGTYANDYSRIWDGINSAASSSPYHTHEWLVGSDAVGFLVNGKNNLSAFETQLYFSGEIYANGVLLSSTEDIKENVQSVSSVLELFSPETSKIYAYNLKKGETVIPKPDGVEIVSTDIPTDVGASFGGGTTEVSEHTSTGFVIGRETPSEVLSEDGEHIDLYSMTSIIWKATQELLLKIQALEETVYAKTS